ncbi:MAG: NAD(P)H-dependent oxidoreductase subunit E [Oligoflexia bacterium]|nr:NAD(P)H-dependent oxidoreductase subunit E [Oligoflexia bacterium]MBF0365236.1 NAD(P)H-dependent oxidoreductase subunit E [Oligoflexia bacterium]
MKKAKAKARPKTKAKPVAKKVTKKVAAKKVATKVAKKVAPKIAKKITASKKVIKTAAKKHVCKCAEAIDKNQPKIDLELILKWIKKHGKESSAAVPILQEIQGQYGYLPREAMDFVVAKTNISASQLYGVATFYAQFRLKPVGRHLIRVCHGTACHVSGADRLNTSVRNYLKIKDKEDTTIDNAYTMEDVACLGCCSLAPVMTIGEEVHGNLTGPMAQKALKRHAEANGEKISE